MGNAVNQHVVQLRADEIIADDFSNMVVTFGTIPTASATVVVPITVVNAQSGKSFGVAIALHFYISSDAAGQVLETEANLAINAGTNGLVAGRQTFDGILITETTGLMDMSVDDNTADVYFINIILPSGKIVTSDAVTTSA